MSKQHNTTIFIGIAVCGALLLGALFMILRAQGQGSQAQKIIEVQIVPSLQTEGVNVRYVFGQSVKQVMLPLPPDLASSITIAKGGPKAKISAEGDQLQLTAARGFTELTLVLDPDLPVPEKDTPVVQLGDKAAVLDFARFVPVAVDGAAPKISDGKRFRWLGRRGREQAASIRLYLEASLPLWIRFDLPFQLDQLMEEYGRSLGPGPQDAPDLMMLYADGPEGVYRIEGDTVPGQIMLRLAGGGFRAENDQSTNLVLRIVAHELAHIWQLQNVGTSASPDWLHEGMASALGDEALYLAHLWTEDRYRSALNKVTGDCADAMRRGPIAEAPVTGHHQASYACGQLLVLVSAKQVDGATISQLWLAFTAWATDHQTGLSEDAFISFMAEWTDNAEFALSIKRFVTTDYTQAKPANIIAKLLAGEL